MPDVKQKISFIAIFLIFVVVVLVVVLSLQTDKVESTDGYLNIKKENTLVKKESCLQCHTNVSGFTKSHKPEEIGCSSCHHGNINSVVKEEAHKGMILIPGNLSNAKQTCGTSGCHPGISERVDSSVMSTMRGVISVDKFVFGESNSLNGKYHVEKLGNSAADNHLKHLCASCHLGNEKKEYGKITEKSRGGGCNACHLNYTKNALAELDSVHKENNNNIANMFHPSLSLKVTNEHCFGCHSRSGRISTNYEGWHETTLEEDEVEDKDGFRLLEDGRIFKFVKADVHYKAGLSCIDCHTSYEIMGDGVSHLHKEEQTTVQCSDCHSKNHQTISLSEFDYESKKIAELRNFNIEKRKFIKIKKSERPLINTDVDENGNAKLIGKNNDRVYSLSSPNVVCTEAESHKNLSCNSCHTTWAPQCVGCHTEYNPKRKGYDLLNHKGTKDSWVEYVGEYFAELPTLGIVENKSGDNLEKKVEPFIPGMIMTLDKSKYQNNKSKEVFKRLFAPSVPHTIQKESRSCESCHNNPLALGYGRGELTYEIANGKGSWKFTPTFEKYEQDNLPQDAWIGFLTEPKKNIGTRENVRPFNLEEQKKILTVGACLTCHKSNSKVMKESLFNFNKVLNNLSKQCILPKWIK